MRVLSHPEVAPWTTDDLTPIPSDETYRSILELPQVYALMPNEMSVFMLFPRNAVCSEVHTSILPEGRGKEGLDAAKRTIAWIWENTPIVKVISFVPSCNRPAILFALQAGLRKEGLIKKSFLKNGILYDEILVGISKEDTKWPQR
jgi:hypothetical protein